MSETRLEQFALDWQRISEGWIKRLEAEMDEAFDADDVRRYRFAALLKGDIQSARSVMLQSMGMGRPEPVTGQISGQDG